MSRLAAVSAAVERGAWDEALGFLDEAGADAASAEGLELRANAEYGNGGFEASIGAWEDLHTLLVQQGDPLGAARAAGMLAMFLMMDTGLMATVRAWVRRAEKLLVGHDEAPAHAILAVVRAYERFMCGDMDAARRWSSAAIDLGTRMSVAPVVVVGRVCAARVRIFDGDVQEGIDQLDELAIDLMSGLTDPLTTGIMYCELICAAQGMALHDRASTWTDTMNRWRDGAAIGAVSGRCRVHRAEILRVTGPCDAAEAEALGACDELRPWMRREFGWPLVELGNIRLRRGDLVGAEEAFLAAHERAWSPHPGLALLRLEQGDAEGAATMIADAIAHPYEIPSKMRPPFGDLRLAPLLDAQVVIAAAIGDAATTRRAAEALAAIAASYPSASLAASAALAEARASLVEGDNAGAIHAAKVSIAAWAEIDAPFEAGAARLVLGVARDRSGDLAGASMERRAAAAAFELFGATRWAEHAHAFAESMPQQDVPAATRVDQTDQVTNTANFRCDGDTRTIEYGGKAAFMRDLKGLRYVARLLADPGREFHVLDLVAVESGAWSRTEAAGEDAATRSFSLAGSALPAIDDAARAAYRRRLAEVNEDIEDARRMNDLGRIELAERDRDYLIAELASAIGLGGVVRSTGGSAERARTSVTRSLRYSIDRLAEHHPVLGAHLGQSINTGTYCSYTPDPLAPIAWRL